MNLQIITEKKKILIIISLLVIISFAIILIQKINISQPEILAKVDSKIITKTDFLLNYEFGLPHLKIGKTPLERKKNYLQFMINEYLLALDAEAKGLDDIPRVKFQTERIRKELLLEIIIENDVKSKIHIGMDGIKKAIEKSKVSFKFFYWPENDLRNAKIIKEKFEQDGIEETFKKLGSQKSDFHFDISKYITDYKTWLDMPEETFEAIKDLPVNQFSDPIKIDDLYFIFQVQDIRRESITTNEYLDKAPTFRKILYSEKLQEEVVKFVDNLVTPLHIKTKAKVFRVFTNAVIDWYRAEDKESLIFSDWVKVHKETVSVKKFYNYQDSVFITYAGGEFTLDEFQNHFYFNRITEEYHTSLQFKSYLNNILAISIRDYFLELEAIEKEYDQTPWFKHEFCKWSSKFAFEELLSRYMTKASTDNDSIKNRINRDLDSLEMKYEIIVDYTMLDTIKIKETDKLNNISIQLFKQGNNRLAEPIVDGHWRSIAK